MRKLRKAVFLDRDGTIIKDKGYLNKVSGVEFYKDAFKALKILQDKGYVLVGVSNQSGIARGYITVKQVDAINNKVINVLKKNGIKLSGIYYCSHIGSDRCGCRKPKTGLAKRAARDLGIGLKRSYVIGDKLCDVGLGTNLKAATILVLTGRGRKEYKKLSDGKVKVAANLTQAARLVE